MEYLVAAQSLAIILLSGGFLWFISTRDKNHSQALEQMSGSCVLTVERLTRDHQEQMRDEREKFQAIIEKMRVDSMEQVHNLLNRIQAPEVAVMEVAPGQEPVKPYYDEPELTARRKHLQEVSSGQTTE